MKKMKLWSLVLLAAMMLSVVAACGGGDDGGGNNFVTSPGSPITVNGKRLVKITESIPNLGITSEIPIAYNSAGQIEFFDLSAYTYEENKIKVKSTGPSYGFYTLINGRATEYINDLKDPNIQNYENDGGGKYTYEYDNSGQMIGMMHHIVWIFNENGTNRKYDGYTDYRFQWEDGNITKITGTDNARHTYNMSYTYTNIENNIPPFYTRPPKLIDLMHWMGYKGKRIKNLPAKEIDYSSSSPFTTTWDYVVNNGLVTKVTKKEGANTTTVYELEWQ